MDIIQESAKEGNGRKVWYAKGRPGELKDARPGDTVVVEDRVYTIGRDWRLYRVA